MLSPAPQLDIPYDLEALRRAKRYQEWVSKTISPYLGSRILEIGSGIGNMSRWLPVREKLVLTEADPELFSLLKKTMSEHTNTNDKINLELVDLNDDWAAKLEPHAFDTIVSFNVLEHIEDDTKTVERLLGLLERSSAKGPKRLVTFVPAHQWSYGTIDKKLKHFRRYNVRDFERIAKACGFKGKVFHQYFNLFGLPGWWFVNKILKKDSVSLSNVKTFEAICPFISPVDNFLHKKLRLPLGQSLLVVMELPT